MNNKQKASKKPTIAQLNEVIKDLMNENEERKIIIEELKKKEEDRAALEKANAELMAQLKSLEAPKPEAPTSFHLDELDIEIVYDKEQNGKPKNYWGRLVNATINSNGSRFFQLLGEDGQYRMFSKEKTVNAEEVSVAVEKMFALRRQAAQDELFAR